jgi:hypothetical protein
VWHKFNNFGGKQIAQVRMITQKVDKFSGANSSNFWCTDRGGIFNPEGI